MRFFNVALAAAAFPALVITSPTVMARDPVPAAKWSEVTASLSTAVQDLQTRKELADLGSILGNLSGTLGGLQQLASPDDLVALHSAINNAAKLLSGSDTQTVNTILSHVGARDLTNTILGDLTNALPGLLSSGAKLLDGGLFPNLTTIVGDVGTLLNSPVVGDLAKALPGLLSSGAKLLDGGLFHNLTNVIGARDLTDNSTLGNITSALPGVLSSGVKLLDGGLFQNLTDLLVNAHDLLDPTFVKDTKGLIEDIYPIVAGASQLLGGLFG